MKKTLYLVQHGPEIRFLDSIQNTKLYGKISLLVSKDIKDEVSQITNGAYDIIIMPSKLEKNQYKIAHYLTLLCDSVMRRLNEKRGIKSFSYSRSKCNRNNHSFLKRSITNSVLSVFVFPLFYITKVICKYYYKDIKLQKIFNNNYTSILLFDHLGGTDYIAYNAKLSALRVEYYLNNHKDITIRPYVPLIADIFYIWFSEQKEMIYNICDSHKKIHTSGMVRIKSLMRKNFSKEENNIKNKSIIILHCCSDPKRRPYEIYSLNNLCQYIQSLNIPISLNIRLNPMDNSKVFKLLECYTFVKILESGWKWNEKKFINIPSNEAEELYIMQIKEADIVSSLPSTTLIEGICFNRKVICYTDQESIDYKDELNEIDMIIPKSIQQNNNFLHINNVEDYIKQVKDLNIC